MKNLQTISIATAIVLAVSGCVQVPFTPNIYELASPMNQCNGNQVFLEVSSSQPIMNPYNDSGLQTDDVLREILGASTELTIRVNDENGNEVSDEVLADLEIDFRFGLFNENGFQSISEDFFADTSPFGPPTEGVTRMNIRDQESFLDFFWGTGDVEDGVLAIPVSKDTLRESKTLIEILRDSGVSEAGDEEALAVLVWAASMYPSAFLLRCVDENVDAIGSSYVDAAPIFTNSSVLDLEPSASVLRQEGEGDDLDSVLLEFSLLEQFPQELMLISGSINPLLPRPLSEDPATDRWLNRFSTTIDNQRHSRIFGNANFFDDQGSLDASEVAPLAPGGYRMIVTYFLFIGDPNSAIESILSNLENPESSTDAVVLAGNSYYDLDVSGSGQYSFTLVRPPFVPIRSASSRSSLNLVPNQLPVVLSTKGHRELVLRGTDFDSVTSVTAGSKEVEVAERSSSTLKINIPRLEPGTHDLVLNHSRGALVESDALSVYRSSVVRTQVVSPTAQGPTWLAAVRRALASNPQTVQVNCVVGVPAGSSDSTARKLARKICKQIAEIDSSVKTRVVTKSIPAFSEPSLTLRYWK